MKNKLKLVVVIIIIAAVTTVGIRLALKIKDLSFNLRTSTNITSNLKVQIEKLQQENEGYRKKLEEAENVSESQTLKISSMGKDRQELTARVSNIQKELEEAEKVSESQTLKISSTEKDRQELTARISNLQKELEDKTTKVSELEKELVLTRELIKPREGDGYLPQTAELKENLNRTLKELSEANKKNKKLQEEVADMHYNLGVILTEQNKFSAAIKEYEKVLELKPDDKDSHYNLGVIYDKYLNNNQKALEHYRAYLKIAPQDKDSQKVRKWVIDKETELKVKD